MCHDCSASLAGAGKQRTAEAIHAARSIAPPANSILIEFSEYIRAVHVN
jgi:hypothetical protein